MCSTVEKRIYQNKSAKPRASRIYQKKPNEYCICMEKTKKIPNMSVAVIIDPKEGLMLLKEAARGINKGYVAGPGGKQEKGESLAHSAEREVLEETGISVKLKPAGYKVCYENGQEYTVSYFMGVASSSEDKIISTPEGKVGWVKISEIPYNRLRPEEEEILPKILEAMQNNESMSIRAEVHYQPDFSVTVSVINNASS